MPARKRQKREVEEASVPEVDDEEEEEEEEAEEDEAGEDEDVPEDEADDDEDEGDDDDGDEGEVYEDEEEEDGDGDEDEDAEASEEEAIDEDDGTDSRPSRRSSRKSTRSPAPGGGRRRGNTDNTNLKPSHGLMTAASAANTPRPSGATMKRSTSGRRRRGGGKDDDNSDEEEDGDKDDDAFASSTLPQADQEKRPFKNLDVTTQIPIRVMRKKKGAVMEVLAKKYSIPAPPTTAGALTFQKVLEGTFKPPVSYIRFRNDMVKPADYEMTYEDEVWLKQKYPKMSPLVFEKIFTTFEVVQGNGTHLSQAKAFPYVQRVDPTATKQVSDDIFAYWGSRRSKTKRPILRRFWPITPAEDQTPTLTFRPREKERYRLRKKRQNDIESYEKMCYLKRDFDRFKDLLELTKRREELKRLEADLIHAEYLERLNPTNQRPACLNVPLASQLEVPDNFDFLGMHQHTDSHRMPLPPIRLSLQTNRYDQQSAAYQQQQQIMEEQRALQKKAAGRGRRSDGDAEFARQPSGSASVISATASVASADERKTPPTVVPVPRFLIEPVQASPVSRSLATLFPVARKHTQALKVEYVPRLGRNRRLVYERVRVPKDAQVILTQPKPTDPFLPPLDRFNKIMYDEVDSDDEEVGSMEQVLLRASGGRFPTPRFHLMMRSGHSSSS